MEFRSPVELDVPLHASRRREATLALAYFAAYLGYLFVYREGEVLHWLSMVLLPVAGLYWLDRRQNARHPLRFTLASIGLAKTPRWTGLGWALLAGVLINGVMLLGRQGREAMALVASIRGLYLLPLTLALLLATAATTEEVLFRGVLQTRLTHLIRSRWGAVVLTSLLFGFYHLPYAYFSPNWPSAGDWSAALTAAFANGIPGGLVLGGLFVVARGNLLAPIVTHACINLIPALRMLDGML